MYIGIKSNYKINHNKNDAIFDVLNVLNTKKISTNETMIKYILNMKFTRRVVRN